jgi:hypothetical protein
MRLRAPARALLAVMVVGVLLAAGFGLGRITGPDRKPGSGTGDRDGYLRGLIDGRASGLAQGRAEQSAAGLTGAQRAGAVAQFRAGYLAGADDVFSGYDGGWVLGRRYAVVLGAGLNGQAYRIVRREDLGPVKP